MSRARSPSEGIETRSLLVRLTAWFSLAWPPPKTSPARLARMLRDANLRLREACIEDVKALPERGLPQST